jgi:hypothetical protein
MRHAESGWRRFYEGARRRLAAVMAWVKRVSQRIAAKFAKGPFRTEPMLDILRLPMTKETLAKMTPEERSLFLLLGYASNQVNVLWKLVIIATNYAPDDPTEQRVTGAQTQIFVRLTIGVMREAWSLIERGFLKSKIGKEYAPLLDEEARAGLDNLKKAVWCVKPAGDDPKQLCFPSPDDGANGSRVPDGNNQQR